MASRRATTPVKSEETEDIDTGILDEPDTEPVEPTPVEPEEPATTPMSGDIPDVGAAVSRPTTPSAAGDACASPATSTPA